MTMIIEFERNVQDVINFNLYHLEHSPSSKRSLIGDQILTVALTGLLLFSLGQFAVRDYSTFTYATTILGCVLAGVLYRPLNRASVKSRIQKMLKEGDNSAILGKQVISFLPEGILAKNRGSESKFDWSSIAKVEQNDSYVFLYISSYSAMIIPKRAFASAKLQQELMDFINTHRGHANETSQSG